MILLYKDMRRIIVLVIAYMGLMSHQSKKENSFYTETIQYLSLTHLLSMLYLSSFVGNVKFQYKIKINVWKIQKIKNNQKI